MKGTGPALRELIDAARGYRDPAAYTTAAIKAFASIEMGAFLQGADPGVAKGYRRAIENLDLTDYGQDVEPSFYPGRERIGYLCHVLRACRLVLERADVGEQDRALIEGAEDMLFRAFSTPFIHAARYRRAHRPPARKKGSNDAQGAGRKVPLVDYGVVNERELKLGVGGAQAHAAVDIMMMYFTRVIATRIAGLARSVQRDDAPSGHDGAAASCAVRDEDIDAACVSIGKRVDALGAGGSPIVSFIAGFAGRQEESDYLDRARQILEPALIEPLDIAYRSGALDSAPAHHRTKALASCPSLAGRLESAAGRPLDR